MARLITCKACGVFKKPKGACPACGAAHVSVGAVPTTAALLLGLAFAGCDDGGDTGENALYGVMETDIDTDTGTAETDVDTDTGEQADYGVADTDNVDTGDQADYGVGVTDFAEDDEIDPTKR